LNIKILSFIGDSVSNFGICKKILSEVCGHDIGNLNDDSIGNLGEFANKSPQPLFIKRGTHARFSSLIKEGDHEVVEDFLIV
jgi:hypothetical protein